MHPAEISICLSSRCGEYSNLLAPCLDRLIDFAGRVIPAGTKAQQTDGRAGAGRLRTFDVRYLCVCV